MRSTILTFPENIYHLKMQCELHFLISEMIY